MRSAISYLFLFFLTMSLYITPWPHINTQALANDFVTWKPGDSPIGDCTRKEIPEISLPDSKWEVYADPNFNTTIRRFTDGNVDEWDIGSAVRPYIQYTPYPNSNADSSIITVGGGRYVHFYRAGDGQHLRTRRMSYPSGTAYDWNNDIEWRWSHIDPDVGYFVYRMNLCKYNFASDTITLIKLYRQFKYPGLLAPARSICC